MTNQRTLWALVDRVTGEIIYATVFKPSQDKDWGVWENSEEGNLGTIKEFKLKRIKAKIL